MNDIWREVGAWRHRETHRMWQQWHRQLASTGVTVVRTCEYVLIGSQIGNTFSDESYNPPSQINQVS